METIYQKFLIKEAVSKFAYFADHHEWDNLKNLFTNQIALDYTSLNGGEPTEINAELLIKNWESLLTKFKAIQHVISNHIIEVQDGSNAICKAYFHAIHDYPNEFGDSKWILGGEYEFSLLKENNEWKINGITMIAKWGSGNQNIMNLVANIK